MDSIISKLAPSFSPVRLFPFLPSFLRYLVVSDMQLQAFGVSKTKPAFRSTRFTPQATYRTVCIFFITKKNTTSILPSYSLRALLYAQLTRDRRGKTSAVAHALLPASLPKLTRRTQQLDHPSPSAHASTVIITIITSGALAARRARMGRRHVWSRGHAWRGSAPGTANAPAGENASAGRTPDVTAPAAQWRDCIHDSRVLDTACGAGAW